MANIYLFSHLKAIPSNQHKDKNNQKLHTLKEYYLNFQITARKLMETFSEFSLCYNKEGTPKLYPRTKRPSRVSGLEKLKINLQLRPGLWVSPLPQVVAGCHHIPGNCWNFEIVLKTPEDRTCFYFSWKPFESSQDHQGLWVLLKWNEMYSLFSKSYIHNFTTISSKAKTTLFFVVGAVGE